MSSCIELSVNWAIYSTTRLDKETKRKLCRFLKFWTVLLQQAKVVSHTRINKFIYPCIIDPQESTCIVSLLPRTKWNSFVVSHSFYLQEPYIGQISPCTNISKFLGVNCRWNIMHYKSVMKSSILQTMIYQHICRSSMNAMQISSERENKSEIRDR